MKRKHVGLHNKRDMCLPDMWDTNSHSPSFPPQIALTRPQFFFEWPRGAKLRPRDATSSSPQTPATSAAITAAGTRGELDRGALYDLLVSLFVDDNNNARDMSIYRGTRPLITSSTKESLCIAGAGTTQAYDPP
ncbi:uncharacterized protein PHACADRAFT_24215 [Phanerochaete carnosa HHB-10118-sp]|uniref:Uncharacterized protein n=1 Tax=Phanerochaete carnosa (strain HHB-10118-sp) TaxID=650164 RepID=K5WAM8_PHACS|nr:uncharacterized protein PHACADRAFT_24215 [Phanerochaete carnosa HHB-10118-sp]EKM60993.1 hypothetical protein PHACADRAFT_24215 [Phanerochaete carnosa HHB-10118-sp]